MEMKYKITFFDYWHLGSGTSAGAKLDSLVVKESNGLPYVPGKTVKGLLRDMAEEIDSSKIATVFGSEGSDMSQNYFSNAILNTATEEHLVKNRHLIKHLYSSISSTKIGENGIAKDSSLREIEVVVPLVLYGEIECKNKDTEEILVAAMDMIKQIGLNRNRGLGRCQFSRIGND
ncbi:MAG TPA: CRISPR-associated protein [Sulfurospirillum arcachonense]|nr:CRISPR-associated protein [Sulfurospirillum arcachonense]